MKPSKYPIEKMIQILAEGESPGHSIAEVCRKYDIARSTYDKWRKKYSGLSCDEAKRLKVLDSENNNLKRLLAEKELEIQALRDVLKKNF